MAEIFPRVLVPVFPIRTWMSAETWKTQHEHHLLENGRKPVTNHCTSGGSHKETPAPCDVFGVLRVVVNADTNTVRHLHDASRYEMLQEVADGSVRYSLVAVSNISKTVSDTCGS